MSFKRTSSLLALHFSLMLVACGPTPTPPVNQPTGTPTASAIPTPTASGTTETPSPSPTSITPSGTPTTPAPTNNPASGSSATVTLPNGSKLVISLGNRYLEAKGQTIQLQASLVDAAGQPVPLSSLKLLFSSSRPQDISVSDSGLVTALVDQGFADITVNVEGTELKATQLVSVNAIEQFGGGGGGGGSAQPSPSPLEDLDVDVEFEGLGVGEFQVNTHTTFTQSFSAIAMDSDGDFVVTWQSDGQDSSNFGIYAQRYNSAGMAQGSEFRVNTYTTNEQRKPVVTMDSDGDFVIAWQSDSQDGSFNGIYAQRYNTAGVAQGSEFQVNTYTLNAQFLPAIAMDNDGDFVITWVSDGQDGDSYGVYAQRYNSAGTTQGSEFRVSTYTTSFQSRPAIAIDSDGDFIITWSSASQDSSTVGIYAQRYNTAGVAQGSEFQVNSFTTNAQVQPAVAMDSDGDFVISWRSDGQDGGGYGIYAQRYNSAGVAQGSEFKTNTYTTTNQGEPAIATDSGGDFVIVWQSNGQDGSGYGIYGKRYNASGLAQ